MSEEGLDVEVIGDALDGTTVEKACVLAAATAGVERRPRRRRVRRRRRRSPALNAEHRGKTGPTDVLSFPVDGAEPASPASASWATS